MDILITGHLAPISSSFCDKLTKTCRVVASSGDIHSEYIGKTYKNFTHAVNDEAFSRLFNIYSFDAMVYFIKRPELGDDNFDELQVLDKALSLCAKNNVTKVIFVSSTYLYNGIPNATENTVVDPADSEGLLLWSCERLCEFYRDQQGLSILSLHTPCLFGHYENQSMIGQLLYHAVTQNYIKIEGQKNQIVDFLSQEDLGELISRILEEWPEDIPVMNISGASSMTLMELGNSFGNMIHNTRVSFSGRRMEVYPPVNFPLARSRYDWVPVIDISSDMPSLVEHIQKEGSEKLTIKQKIRHILGSKSVILKTVELVLGYLLMEYLNNLTATAVQFRYVDFRLLYIVILAIVHGLKAGVAASLLASFSCGMSYMSNGMDWRVLVYNIDNWLPFACYIIAGAVIGFTKDKMETELGAVTDEKDTLEKRYAFLSELYQNALQSKNQYKKQIMSYRNSFGRIFEVTRRLNSVTPDVVFKEALYSLEDILDNQSICIYNVAKNNHFARLNVCSKKILESMPKSIDLNNYSDIMTGIPEGEVWTNTACDPHYPDYIFPIFRSGNLISLIMVTKASNDQMAMYYENLIKILCNLIEDSLIRAQEYTDEFGAENYIPGSHVLKKEPFKKILSIREQMVQDSIAEYSMLCVNADSNSIVDIAGRLSSYFRESDVFGQGEDGNLYIILAQAGKETASRIIERLKNKGIL